MTPGDSIRVRFEAGQPAKHILVSELAVGSQQQQKFVYVVNDKDEVEFRPVVPGQSRDGLQIIDEGLTVKDRVVVNGLLRVRPGVKVVPKVEEPADKK